MARNPNSRTNTSLRVPANIDKQVETMTAQQLFKYCIGRLAWQGCQSINDQICAYRGVDISGRVVGCPVGHLIPQRLYDPTCESNTVAVLVDRPSFAYMREHAKLLVALQRLHDQGIWWSSWYQLSSKIESIADEFELDMKDVAKEMNRFEKKFAEYKELLTK